MLLTGVTKVPVGTVIKPHGIKGELNVALEPDAEDSDFAPDAPLILELEGLDVPFFVGDVRPRGADSILLTLDGIDSDTEAATLQGLTLWKYADAATTPDDGELTADRLVGYTITDGDTEVGVIADITELSPDCWYFVLEGSGKLIPIADEMITDIDPDARTVDMDLPQGLLEL